MTDNAGKYDVGFGKPPKSGQFKKGHSGNRKGRPKGARGLKTDLKAELAERVSITENGKTRKLTKQQLLVKRLATSALKGDIRAISKLVDMVTSMLGVEDEVVKGPASLSINDEAVLSAYNQRQRDGEMNDDG